jgi:hypothetical protein
MKQMDEKALPPFTWIAHGIDVVRACGRMSVRA